MPFHVVFHINLYKRNRNDNTGILNFTASRITQDLSKIKHNCTMNRKDRNMVIHDLEFYLNQEWKTLKIIEYSFTFSPSTSDHKIEEKGQQGWQKGIPLLHRFGLETNKWNAKRNKTVVEIVRKTDLYLSYLPKYNEIR